jgi:hypothetical protein
VLLVGNVVAPVEVCEGLQVKPDGLEAGGNNGPHFSIFSLVSY